MSDEVEQEMIEGYRDGFRDDRADLPAATNYSAAYQHGWRNGRDDRMKKPRATAAHNRRVAGAIIGRSEGWGGGNRYER